MHMPCLSDVILAHYIHIRVYSVNVFSFSETSSSKLEHSVFITGENKADSYLQPFIQILSNVT